jgi:hypothetical protein
MFHQHDAECLVTIYSLMVLAKLSQIRYAKVSYDGDFLNHAAISSRHGR